MAEVPDWAKSEEAAPSWATDSVPAPKFQTTGDPLVDERIRSGFLAGQGMKPAPTRAPSDISEQVLGPAKKSISEGLAERGLSGLGKTGMGALEYALNLPAALTAQYAPTFLVTQGGRMPEDVARRKLAADLTMMQQVAVPELAEAGPSAILARKMANTVKDTPASLSLIEKKISPATSTSAVGEKIEKNLTSRLENLTKSRRQEFESVKDNYINAGKTKETELLSDYKSLLQDLYAKSSITGSQDERKLIEKLWERISDRPSILGDKKGADKFAPGFEAIEKERRFLNDIVDGLKVEGAEGIQAASAKDMAQKLEQIIANRIPKEFKSFKDIYTSLSEPINEFSRSTGAKVVKRADEYLPEISDIDPAKLPDTFFKTRRSVNDLRSLSGDEKFVQQMAREHIAVELRNAKEAKEIRKFMAENYDWLQEFPQIKQDLESIASSTKGAETRKAIAKFALKSAVTIGLGGVGAAGYNLFFGGRE